MTRHAGLDAIEHASRDELQALQLQRLQATLHSTHALLLCPPADG
jgi:phenylacetate-coenzyme A ligase PaaK-like adenylate-forming protein